MATRKRKSGGRRKTTTRARTASYRAPAKRAAKRNPPRRRGTTVARARRRSNPSGKLVPLAIGAATAQMLAGFIPFGGGPFIEAAKIFGVGWALEKFLGRTLPMAFSEARDGSAIAAGVLLLNAYVVPSVRGAVGSVLPNGNGNGDRKGVNNLRGFMTVPGQGQQPLLNAPVQAANIAGAMTVPRYNQ